MFGVYLKCCQVHKVAYVTLNLEQNILKWYQAIIARVVSSLHDVT